MVFDRKNRNLLLENGQPPYDGEPIRAQNDISDEASIEDWLDLVISPSFAEGDDSHGTPDISSGSELPELGGELRKCITKI